MRSNRGSGSLLHRMPTLGATLTLLLLVKVLTAAQQSSAASATTAAPAAARAAAAAAKPMKLLPLGDSSETLIPHSFVALVLCSHSLCPHACARRLIAHPVSQSLSAVATTVAALTHRQLWVATARTASAISAVRNASALLLLTLGRLAWAVRVATVRR